MKKHTYVHCAAGQGRTGFYLTALIMFIKGIEFSDARKIVDEHYSFATHEIDFYKDNGDRFYREVIQKK